MRNLKIILKREYLARIRNKTFMVMTFVSPVAMVLMILLVAFLSNLNNDKSSVIAVYDPSAVLDESFKSSEDITYKDFSDYAFDSAKDSVKKKDYTGLLVIPKPDPDEKTSKVALLTNSSPESDLIATIEHKLSKTFTDQKLKDQHINPEQIKQAHTDVHIELEDFSGQKSSNLSGYVKIFFGAGVGYLLMMFIVVYGNLVMRSVIEEKTNRIIELIISSVKPLHLMLGKILGSSLAGITQFLIWIFFGGLLLIIAGNWFDIDITSMSAVTTADMNDSSDMIEELLIDVLNLPLLKLTILFLIYFLLGFFLYSAIYAAVGAAVESETDTQQFIFPITFPLMLGFFVGFFSVIGNPDGIMPIIFSYIPLTSPIVMLMRIPFGVAWWEILISLVILSGSIIGTAWVGSKIYRVGILMYGKKPSYKELIKWLKY